MWQGLARTSDTLQVSPRSPRRSACRSGKAHTGFHRRNSKQHRPPTFHHPRTPSPPVSASRAPCHLSRDGPSSSPNPGLSVRLRRRQSVCRTPSRQTPRLNPVVRELWGPAVRGSQRLLTIPLHSRNTTISSVSLSLTLLLSSSPANLSSRARVRCPGRYGRR